MFMPVMMPAMPNFGDIASRDHGNRMFDRGDDVRNRDPFSMNKNMHNSNR